MAPGYYAIVEYNRLKSLNEDERLAREVDLNTKLAEMALDRKAICAADFSKSRAIFSFTDVGTRQLFLDDIVEFKDSIDSVRLGTL